MRLFEIENSKPSPFSSERRGSWKIDTSNSPIKMGKYTGDTAKFVSRATHANGKTFEIGVGDTAELAKQNVIQKIHQDDERPENIGNFKTFAVNFNVHFSNEYFDEASGGYFKFDKVDGQTVLSMASVEYFNEFGESLTELGFRLAKVRISSDEYGRTGTKFYSFTISRNIMEEFNLVPNMRYSVNEIGYDEDGNKQFGLYQESRTTSSADHKQLPVAAITIAATVK